MDEFSARLNSFLKVLSNNKLWALATPLFMTCLWYAATFYYHAPAEWINLNARRDRLDRVALEGQVVDRIYGTMLDALQASKNAHIAYADFVDLANQEQKIPGADQVSSTLQKVTDANNQISLSIGVLESASSNNADVDRYAQEFAADLKTFQPLLNEMSKTLESIQQEDQAAALSHVAAQKDLMIQWPLYLKKMAARMAGFSNMTTINQETEASEARLLRVDTEAFYLRFYLSVAAVVYMLVFGILLGRKLTMYYRAEDGKKAKRRRKRK